MRADRRLSEASLRYVPPPPPVREMVGFLVYFGIGLIWDALITIDTLFVIRGNVIGVVVTSAVLTILSTSVFTQYFDVMGFWKIAGLAMGSGVGAGGAVYFERKRRGKK